MRPQFKSQSAGGPVSVELSKDCSMQWTVPLNVVGCYNNVITTDLKFKTVLAHVLCQFVTNETQNNKLKVVYYSIIHQIS